MEMADAEISYSNTRRPKNRSTTRVKRKCSEYPNEARKRRAKDRTQCPVCLDHVNSEKMIRVDSCDCRYCKSCIKQSFVMALDKTCFPAKCCGRELDVSVFQHILPKLLVKRYRRLVEEGADSTPLYCAASSCRMFISSTTVKDKFGSCATCHQKTCRQCKRLKADHLGFYSICTDGEAELDELAEREGWRRCPKCHIVIEKLSGCNDLRCYCRIEWCYKCGKPVRGQDCCICHTAGIDAHATVDNSRSADDDTAERCNERGSTAAAAAAAAEEEEEEEAERERRLHCSEAEAYLAGTELLP